MSTDTDKKPIANRPVTWIVAVVALVFLVAVVGPFVYINFIRDDAPERLGFDDAPPATSDTTASLSGADSTTNLAEEPPASDGDTGAEGIDGTWVIAEGSQAGYRAKEILFGQDIEAVGRTPDVTGELTIEGTTITATDFVVDVTTLESDEDRRDGQVQGRILDTASFPTATFTLTEPIELDALPGDLEEITVSATGDFTLRGTTKPATFDLVARRNGGTIEVNGLIPVALSEYGIPDASNAAASVGDDVEIEFLLVFEPA